jgi:GAF domain-containing protein
MTGPNLPLEEILRLEELYSYQILDTPPEQDFDELVELASCITGCPTALISFIDKDRQWFKARLDMPEKETHRSMSLCSHAIEQNELFVIDDASKDLRFMNNPLVTGGVRIRFYAGAPIFSRDGFKLGTICVIDKRSRTLTPKQAQAMKMLSHQVTRLLELKAKTRIIEKITGTA